MQDKKDTTSWNSSWNCGFGNSCMLLASVLLFVDTIKMQQFLAIEIMIFVLVFNFERLLLALKHRNGE